MKKLFLLKSLLLLCALVAGSSSVWAEDDVTYTKVTSVDDLDTDATYIIGDIDSNTARAFGSLSSNRGSIISNGLSVSGSSIIVSGSAETKPVEFTIDKSGDYYTLKMGTSYLGYSGSGTNFQTTTSLPTTTNLNQYQWDITYNSTYSFLLISSVKTSTRYILRNGSSAYGPYSNTNLASYGKATLFKKVDASAPSINANNIDVNYNATSGSISYTINNTVEGATLTASTSNTWISNFTYETGKVNFTVSKNTTLADRIGTVKLTYVNGETTLATKDVTVTQGHLDVTAPTFSPAAGTYNATQNVTISGPDGATIYYTTDGNDPTTSSASYSAAITVNVSKTLKAIAVKDEVSSTIAEAAYTLQVADPTISPNGGSFDDSKEVTLACATSGATIKYTTDGSDPTTEGALTYSDPFTLTETKTVKAVAIIDGWTASAVVTATFTKIDPNDVWVKTGLSSLASGDVFAIVGTKTNSYALANNNGTSSAPTAVSVTISNNMISGEVGNTIKWNVSGNAKDGYTFYPNEITDKWLYCTDTNNGVRVGTNTNKTFTIDHDYLKHVGSSRYVGVYESNPDWRCYESYDATNIKNETFAFYKQGISVTLAAACTDGTKYYSTFSSSVPFKVPEGVTVSEIGINSEGKLVFEEYETGAVVPANIGVMVSATTFGKKTFTPATTNGTSVLGDNNRLRPSGFNISDITATAMATADANCLYYRLTMHNGTTIGFWWGAENGAAFTLAANKAYLAIPKEQAASGFSFDSQTTAIESVEKVASENGVYYNIAGQRVAQPTKGLYIVNGKKVVVK